MDNGQIANGQIAKCFINSTTVPRLQRQTTTFDRSIVSLCGLGHCLGPQHYISAKDTVP